MKAMNVVCSIFTDSLELNMCVLTKMKNACRFIEIDIFLFDSMATKVSCEPDI